MTGAIANGHKLPPPLLEDVYLERQGRGYFNRCAWIDGLGLVTKTVTVFPENRDRQPPLPTVQGAVLLFDDEDGKLLAVMDGALVTRWKTTADSVLAATLLARPDSQHLLMVGAGAVASAQLPAYAELFPGLRTITLWNRSRASALALAERTSVEGCRIDIATDLATAVADADIVSCATFSSTPLIHGDWVQPGTHVDLIGAFLPTMREADDQLLQKARIYVDSRETTLKDIGELCIPLSTNVISEADILGDLYELISTTEPLRDPDDITVFKNGGGGHLDLMCARFIYDVYTRCKPA